MRDAVIGSTAQTPIGKAYHGALSDISGPSSPRTPSPPPSAGQGSPARRSTTSPWAAPCRKAPPALRGPAGRAPRRTARRRAGRDPRPAVRLRADGDRDRRQADHRRRHDRHRRRRRRIDLAGAERARTLAVRRTRGWDHGRSIYISMLDTAENVAERYRVSREAQDASALTSQQRTAVAQQNGLFAGGKIVPFKGNRLGTTLAGLAGLKPVRRSRGARGRRRSSDGAGERPERGDESLPAAVMLAAQGERYGNDPAPSLVLPEYARGIQRGAT